ncbi:ATP-binding protein [Hyalangium sp.]|uniref:ATP-binding protein n=1 Tax=Hyalangium sp. TaxID=2028555 RepID=UPI002D693E5D|nr:cache domain-containing protein [Hyalangium sp.]HYI02877.1 cache domain-containing protein [Hyalangium sp.]
MPRLHFHAKLLLAFGAVLLPVLALLSADFFQGQRRTQETILASQRMAAQAVAVQISESFESAIEFAQAVANDPLVRSLDPRTLDAHMQRLVQNSSLYDAIGIYDATGLNRGWGEPDAPAEPRIRIGDRPYFQKVMATGAPVISEVIELRRPKRTAILISVPIPGPGDQPLGVVNVIMQTDLLEQRYTSARLQSGQEILLVDPKGRLAFHTGYPDLTYEQSSAFLGFAPLTLALAGTPVKLDQFTNPLSRDASLGAFVPTPRHGWAVGVMAPCDVALAPLNAWLRMKLAIFIGILLLSGLISAVLARFYAHPVRRLQLLARALARGELGQRVSIQTGDELRELGDAFNEMAARVSQRQAEVDALRAEAERHASQLDAIIASVPDAIFLASPDGRLFDANPAGRRLLGFRERSDLGRPLSEYLERYCLQHVDGRALQLAEMPLQRTLDGETFTDMELRLCTLDGNERLVSINGAPVRNSAGQIILGEIVVHDITERMQVEEERARLLERELALSRVSQALVMEVELERVAHVAIEQSLHALGADAAALWLAKPDHQQLTLIGSHGLGQKIREDLHQISFESPLLTAQAARQETLQVIGDIELGEVPALCRKFAREEDFRSLVAVPLLSRGHLVGVLTCFAQAPRQFASRELEFHTTVGQLFAMAIEKARLFLEVREALRLREEFMSAAAHELRTPVTTIQTWAEILSRMEVNSVRQQKGLTAIARNTRRLAQLVEHLFAAVWMAPGLPKMERDRFDLGEVVEEKVKSISRTTEHPISIEATESLLVDGDRQRMGDVVAHLLENAIRYSPPGASIEVGMQCTGREAVVSVSDHGPGIPPDRQRHVFEPLYEPLPPGAAGYTGVVGLGLHLSWQIVEAHGGRIWLDAPSDEGNTFCFSIPLGESDGLQYASA